MSEAFEEHVMYVFFSVTPVAVRGWFKSNTVKVAVEGCMPYAQAQQRHVEGPAPRPGPRVWTEVVAESAQMRTADGALAPLGPASVPGGSDGSSVDGFRDGDVGDVLRLECQLGGLVSHFIPAYAGVPWNPLEMEVFRLL